MKGQVRRGGQRSGMSGHTVSKTEESLGAHNDVIVVGRESSIFLALFSGEFGHERDGH